MNVVNVNGGVILSYNGRVKVAMIKIYIYITTFDPQDGRWRVLFYFLFSSKQPYLQKEP